MIKLISADHVVPMIGEPIKGGAVAIDGRTIAEVGPFTELIRKFPNAEHTAFGNAAIVPGFVNCHAHLEISAMRGHLDDVEHDFSAWLLKLTARREELSDEQIAAAAANGAAEAVRAGITCVGDIGRKGSVGFTALKESGLRGIVYQETDFSPDDRNADAAFRDLITKFEQLTRDADDRVAVGISPHSPYTVSPRLFTLIAEFAGRSGCKLSIHAAESAAEEALLFTGTGMFTEFFTRGGIEWNSPHCSPVEFLYRTSILDQRPLLAHCIRVSSDDIALIKNTGAAVAHCPRSNAKFGHGWAPLEQIADAGIPVGLGSDSVASNNVNDILAEGRFAALAARNRPERQRFIQPKEILRMATIGGAAAMGLDDRIGSLEPGKLADIAVLSLDSPSQQPIGDIYTALVFSSDGRDTVATYVDGRRLY